VYYAIVGLSVELWCWCHYFQLFSTVLWSAWMYYLCFEFFCGA